MALDRDEGGARGGLPFGLVSTVATGGVEDGDAYLGARIALNGAEDDRVVGHVVSSTVALPVVRLLQTEPFNPPAVTTSRTETSLEFLIALSID